MFDRCRGCEVLKNGNCDGKDVQNLFLCATGDLLDYLSGLDPRLNQFVENFHDLFELHAAVMCGVVFAGWSKEDTDKYLKELNMVMEDTKDEKVNKDDKKD